jgi:shikimate kinase
MTPHWVLVGLMGAGKTTVGELLAKRSGRAFIDNDVQLSATSGRSPRQVQDDEGVAALHALERRALVVALESQPPAVIAAAASVVDDAGCRALLSRSAVVIWLDADVDELARRVHTSSLRPLAMDAVAQFRNQFASRAPLFAEIADITTDAGMRPSQVVNELLTQLSPG